MFQLAPGIFVSLLLQVPALPTWMALQWIPQPQLLNLMQQNRT